MAEIKIDFAKGNGLVPVIVQDYQSRDVLMVAYMNEEAWEKTRATGKAHYYSRSRKGPWFKGEESGHVQ
ncbi:MAG TPA: phosphoribosyl-AMP cyclohydrolase, partial [Candidatus Binatia bacterium]